MIEVRHWLRQAKAKKKAESVEPWRYGVLVRLGEDVVDQAKKVAALKELSTVECLAETLRPIVARDLEHEARRLTGDQR